MEQEEHTENPIEQVQESLASQTCVEICENEHNSNVIYTFVLCCLSKFKEFTIKILNLFNVQSDAKSTDDIKQKEEYGESFLS